MIQISETKLLQALKFIYNNNIIHCSFKVSGFGISNCTMALLTDEQNICYLLATEK